MHSAWFGFAVCSSTHLRERHEQRDYAEGGGLHRRVQSAVA